MTGGNAGHDFKRDAGGGQFPGLLAAAAKDVGIAALEADDAFAGAGFVHQQLVQLVLGNGVVAGAFAGINQFRARRGQAEQVPVDERVIDDHVRAAEQLRPAHGNQAGVARAGADQIDSPFGFHGGQFRGQTPIAQ